MMNLGVFCTLNLALNCLFSENTQKCHPKIKANNNIMQDRDLLDSSEISVPTGLLEDIGQQM